jgi:hypothetical protein
MALWVFLSDGICCLYASDSRNTSRLFRKGHEGVNWR